MSTIRKFFRNIAAIIIGILPACTLFQLTLPEDYFDYDPDELISYEDLMKSLNED